MCKRLNKFTLEELEVVTETDKSLLKPVLEELISQRQLVLRDGIYFYHNEKSTEKVLLKLPLRFQYHSPEVIEIIMRSFCADVPIIKSSLVLTTGSNTIVKFNKFFRKTIYEKQKSELQAHYMKNPQIARCRMFFDTQMHFYFYENQLYVGEELPETPDSEPFTNEQIKEFKKIYSYLNRVTSHNNNKTNLPHHLAEGIWRRNKPFEQLLSELKALLNT
jgi:hypothetical protein